VCSHSIVEILELLRTKETVFKNVKHRTHTLCLPREGIDRSLDDQWDRADVYSIFSDDTEEDEPDFEDEIMKSPAYRKVYRSVRNSHRLSYRRRMRREPVINLLDEDLIELPEHPALSASYSKELEKVMLASSIDENLSEQSTAEGSHETTAEPASRMESAATEEEPTAMAQSTHTSRERSRTDPETLGWTALHRAAYNGHEAAIRLLLEKGADIKATDQQGGTALHWAARNGQEAAIRLLLEKGADIKATDQQGGTALHWAAYKGQDAAIRLLQEKGRELTGQKRTDPRRWFGLR
jgi:Ankyrin repeats (3 copies)